MKFAKELEQDLVPEWRVKYLDYKAGKRYVKAVARAKNRLDASPRTPARAALAPRGHSLYGATSPFNPRNRTPVALRALDLQDDGPGDPLSASPAPLGADSRPDSDDSAEDPIEKHKKTPPMPIPIHRHSEEPSGRAGRYGSFVPTPPRKTNAFPFELPDPAVALELPLHNTRSHPPAIADTNNNLGPDARPQPMRSASMSGPVNAYEVGRTTTPHRTTFASIKNRFPHSQTSNPFLRRMFSVGTPLTESESRRIDMDMVVVDQVRVRQREFFQWMNKELDKVESFYKEKEDEAGARLDILREQLHEMRNRRIEEIADAQHAKDARKEDERSVFDFAGSRSNLHSNKDDEQRPNSRDRLNVWFDPLERIKAKAKAKITRPGANSKALQNMTVSPGIRAMSQNQIADDGRDYVRRAHHGDVPYRTAKRKLKLALQEFYRGMELLKSYALLNRTAFRKINKKYDKAIDAHPPLRYMSEKVNNAWFVRSDVLDGHLHAVEDLYARYFERGNHKIATGKLRSSKGRPADQSASAFRNGILIGTGALFSIQGVIYGADLLYHEDPTLQVQTSYLLQIYGGYFLALYLFSWFCFDCSIWTRNKINYQFVFEFDARHTLDWRQLAEFPSFLILVLGLFVWLNLSRYGTPEMYIYYPVILIFVTAVLIFLPAPILFHRSRRWFVYSHWRLLLAGLYPVEFRDFFLGDMYCSLTYFMSNIELFFCLYANYWNNPAQCNSTHSRLLGFFSTLPGIWRAFQCLRRYYDTRNIFPHLVNCGKYGATILYYVTLSIYRIDKSNTNLSVFIAFATINSVYTSVWDLFMDWSLLQPHASKRFLRDVRGYKNPYYYYAAMVMDPILRFNWIFYAIYTRDLQHSTLVSFLVGFSEITRRGIWTIFRVENEHCSNVARFKASRDVPLPYKLPSESDEDFERREDSSTPEAESTQVSPSLSRRRSRTGAALEAQESPGSSAMRRRVTPARTFTRMVADAHTQDFEKKRKPGAGDSEHISNRKRDSKYSGEEDEVHGSSDDDDDEQDQQDVLDAEALLRERRRPMQERDSEDRNI